MTEAGTEYTGRPVEELPDRVTPDNIDDLSEEEIERINEERSEQLRSAIEEEAGLTADEERALDALMEAEDEKQDTETVELANGVEVSVLTYIPGSVENRVERMSEVASERPTEARRLLAESVAKMIVDDDYGNSEVWREYGRRYGIQKLMEVFDGVAGPAEREMEDMAESMKSFRQV